ncbi:MAG TPA: GyrI-like domain-containing protein [Actinomycetota bacterium]|jgi:effector-binding domain-containing protein|nr:GyrI-like domain-containing protein [Actinomycetota bacterium]
MPYEISTKELPPQHVALVRRATSMAVIGKDIHEGFADLMEAMAGAGVSPSGPPFVVYHGLDDQIDRIEICAPVVEPFEDRGEARGMRIPAGLVACTIHRGRFEEIGPAYQALAVWVREHDRQMAGPPREVYLTDLEATPDPASNVTEVQFPID